MEQEGWNFDHASPEGTTVFFLRDTSHATAGIQERLLDELDAHYTRGHFNTVFLEGTKGEYVPNFGSISENQLKEELHKGYGRWDALEIFGHRHKDEIAKGKLFLVGCDSIDLQKKNKEVVQQAWALNAKMLDDSATKEEVVTVDTLMRQHDRLVLARSIFATEYIAEYMRALDLNTAGVVFGDAHFSQMTSLFREKKIGYISYFPGDLPITFDQVCDYFERF